MSSGPRSSYQRLVERAFDKIRQASTGMPAVMIRQLDALAKLMENTTTDDQRGVVRAQADMILRSAEVSAAVPCTLADVRARYEPLVVERSTVSRALA